MHTYWRIENIINRYRRSETSERREKENRLTKISASPSIALKLFQARPTHKPTGKKITARRIES